MGFVVVPEGVESSPNGVDFVLSLRGGEVVGGLEPGQDREPENDRAPQEC